MTKLFPHLCFVVVLTILVAASSAAQNPGPSIHQRDSEMHKGDTPHRDFSAVSTAPAGPLVPRTAAVTKKVFGYHPYWASSTAYLSYDYAALSTIGYFSYEVNTATGGYTTAHDWSTTPMIAYAHSRGVKVVLVVTNFGTDANTAILSDTVKQNTMITSLIGLLTARGGDGVNMDLESVPAAQRANLVSFMSRLANRVRAAIPGAEISMATPAVDWSNTTWDFAALSRICDYLFLMGYDYYWSGSSTAGPVSPLEGENYQTTRSVTTYLSAGVAPEKLLLGLAWYGMDWPVVSAARKATATAKASSGTYAVLEAKARQYGKQFDAATKTPWFSYQSGSQWHQAWYDDSLSLAYKYEMVKAKNLGGTGMWALSYEGQRAELWQGIRASFAVTSVAEPARLPQQYSLDQNYPNPFNPATTIGYHVAAAGHISIKIFDVLGKDVATLVDGVKAPGSYAASFIADNLPSGVYFCRMAAGGSFTTRKLILER